MAYGRSPVRGARLFDSVTGRLLSFRCTVLPASTGAYLMTQALIELFLLSTLTYFGFLAITR